MTDRRLALGLALALTTAHVSSTGEPLYRPPKPPVSQAAPLPAVVEVWVDLTLPPTASVPRAERAAAHRRVVEQQNETMARLAQLGAVELARVQHARNAIAVRIPSATLDRARAIDGVKAVRVVRHLQRSKP